jgi:hypothetical protein
MCVANARSETRSHFGSPADAGQNLVSHLSAAQLVLRSLPLRRPRTDQAYTAIRPTWASTSRPSWPHDDSAAFVCIRLARLLGAGRAALRAAVTGGRRGELLTIASTSSRMSVSRF